jgi:hypothetical protein
MPIIHEIADIFGDRKNRVDLLFIELESTDPGRTNSHPQDYTKSWVGLIVWPGLLLDAPFPEAAPPVNGRDAMRSLGRNWATSARSDQNSEISTFMAEAELHPSVVIPGI